MRAKRYIQMGWMLSAAAWLLSGCNMALLDPKGQVGMEQRSLIMTAILLMLIVVVPVILMTLWFAWRYRASNQSATYTPNWAHSNKIEAVVWGIPCIIILILGTLTWRSSHSLDPRQPLDPQVKPLVIEAVSLDWKWLFIYPEQGIATVNEIAFPVNVPLHFKVTSGSVMNSFFIPQLGSQIYAMAGMRNQLNLIANEVGSYKGMSANFSGQGFSGMKFTAQATTQQGFDQWLAKVKSSTNSLQMADYQVLAKPSQYQPVSYFSAVQPGLYDQIVDQFMGQGADKMPRHAEQPMAEPHDQHESLEHSDTSAEHEHMMSETPGNGE